MDFYITFYKGHEHLDLQMRENLNEAVAICRNSKAADRFEIHPDGLDHYLSGNKRPNGYIDWERKEIEPIS